MSFPTYAHYKDSVVEWLGEVPAHWTSWKVRHAFDAIGSGTTPPSDQPHWYEGGTVPWVTTGELRENVIFETTKSVTDAAVEQFSALRVHPAGSLVIAMYGATIGRLGVLGVAATTNQACCVLAGPRNLDTRFVYYWLVGFKQKLIDLYATGGGQPNINQEIIAALRIPAPEIEEQDKVVTFLDRETAKLDALITEQRTLIDLLKEKRQAVISHAVTKGLDAGVAMKDSGVEWLGEVPAHWDIRSLRTLASVVRGASPRPAGDPEFFGGNFVPWVTVAEITKDDNVVLSETESFLTEAGADHSRLLVAGTVIYSNSGATLGVPKILGIDACANDGVVGFERVSEFLDPRFLCQYLSSLTSTVRDMVKQGSGQPNLNTGIVKALLIGLPSIEEQGRICRHIESTTQRFAALTSEAEAAMALLQERRSALISAAVTGKIDVRGA